MSTAPTKTFSVNSVNGRPKDSPVWDYYRPTYSIEIDATKCSIQVPVSGGSGPSGSTKACGRVLKGKNPTNMKTAVRY